MTQNGNGNHANLAMGADIIQTTDEDGQVHVFEKVDEYEMDGNRYALLIYQGDEEEEEEAEDRGYDEEIVVMRIVVEEDSEVFEAIEDEEEFQKIVKVIEKSGFTDDPGYDFDIVTDE